MEVVTASWDADLEYGDPETAAAFEAYMTDRPPDDSIPTTNGRRRPTDDDKFRMDVEWQVRSMAVRDAARTEYAAQRSASTQPQPEDVAAVVRGEVAPLLPTMFTRTDGQSLIYPGLLHWLYGPPGLGKTMIAAAVTAQVLTAGGTVGYFDWEGNRTILGDRLRSFGVSAETVEQRFHYYRPGNLEPHREWLAAVCEPWHLCVFDGTAKALAASGRDEERNPDVLAWMEQVLTPILAAECAVLMLDHVTKDPENRSMARGAGAKMGEVSGAAWELKAGQPFNRRTSGYVRLIQRKDREGRTGIDGDTVAEVHVIPRRGGATEIAVRPPAANAADVANQHAMEKVWKAVKAITDTGQDANTNALHRIVGGDKQRMALLLAELADLGHLTLNKKAGKNVWVPAVPYMAPAVEPPPSPITMPGEEWTV